ncbi:MAG: hypothetical protein H0T84_04265 [Tatlockia sp.]|nr:hypothetical protein [Tatlockia sp.]
MAAGLTGAGVGSIAGGIVGALVGWGIPEDKAKAFETGIKSLPSMIPFAPTFNEKF